MARKKAFDYLLRVRITARVAEQIKKQMESGIYGSESDFVRQAIIYALRRADPPYARPSLREREKIATIEEEKQKEEMTDEEYVKRYLKDVYILIDDDGVKFLLYRVPGRDIAAMPLSDVKNWVQNKDYSYQFSQNASKEELNLDPYEELLKFAGHRSTLVNYYNVNISREFQN